MTATTLSASLKQMAGTGTTTFNGAVNATTATGVNVKTTTVALNNTITTISAGVVKFNASETTTIAATGDIPANGAVTMTGAGGIRQPVT